MVQARQSVVPTSLCIAAITQNGFSKDQKSIVANPPAEVKALLRAGANADYRDEFGMTPILAAASIYFGDTDVLRALLAANANLTARTKTGLTAIDLAKKYGHIEVLMLLK